MIEYRKRITRQMLRDEPNTLFVFGDNLVRRGFGGQAREMRGEPNAVGIPTKARPSMETSAFLHDRDLEKWLSVCRAEFNRLLSHDGPIVWPADGIGTGLAQLRDRAPAIWAELEDLRQELER